MQLPTHAISVKQPWAELLFRAENGEPVKGAEFRSWRLPERYVGQPLALHATRGKTELLLQCQRTYGIPYYGYGVIGIVTFGKPVRFTEFCGEILADGHAELDWFWLVDVPGCPEGEPGPGRWWYAWPVKKVVRLTPIPCKGKLNVWELADETSDAMRYQFAQRSDLPRLSSSVHQPDLFAETVG